MRIGIDARALGWAGLGRYSRNLLKNITSNDNENEYVVFAPKSFYAEMSSLPRTRFVSVTASYYSLREQTVFLAAILQEKIDLMHFLHFNAPIFYRRPFVVTIHDLTRFFFPAQKNNGQFHQWAYEEVFRSAVLHSAKIVTVSEHTRSDLIRYFPQVAEKTAVAYEGVDATIFNKEGDVSADKEKLARIGIATPYILFVGVWMTHKNLPRLLLAFRKVKAEGYAGKFVITGEGLSHHVNVGQLVNELGLKDDVVLPGRVSDEMLPVLYRGAQMLVFPSLYEGFGLPPLEAMACGTPVVASRISSIPEILGEAAVYFDPYSVEDIAESINKILLEEGLKEKMVDLGLSQAKNFSWKKCAQETLGVYNTVFERIPVGNRASFLP
jgi:glycosyltransferase involved in cell wall biosynthesis